MRLSAGVKRQNYKTFSYRSNWFLFAVHESEAASTLGNRIKAPAAQWQDKGVLKGGGQRKRTYRRRADWLVSGHFRLEIL